jgi:Polysaccharide deacetylase
MYMYLVHILILHIVYVTARMKTSFWMISRTRIWLRHSFQRVPTLPVSQPVDTALSLTAMKLRRFLFFINVFTFLVICVLILVLLSFHLVVCNVWENDVYLKMHSDVSRNALYYRMHTWSHQWLTSLTNDEVVAELVWNAKAIYQVTGRVPRYFRPPYGDIDARILAIAKAMDIVPILWERDTLDYTMNDGGRTAQTVLSDVDSWISQSNPNGIISLQHDLFELTAGIAPQVHDRVRNARYNTVKISECVSKQNPGVPYATSGKLYQIVTGRERAPETNKPDMNTPNTDENKRANSVPASSGISVNANAIVAATALLIGMLA